MAQADALGLPVSRADSREWYAEMLLARNQPGDVAQARAMHSEAAALYEELKMPTFAARTRARN